MLNKDQWVALMKATGLDDEAMKKFHQEFEKLSAKDHQEFLEILKIAPDEINEIRDWSK